MKVKGKLRSISAAALEVRMPESTLRGWDEMVQPYRIACGSIDSRYYDDTHIARIFKLIELNKTSKAARSGHAVQAQ